MTARRILEQWAFVFLEIIATESSFSFANRPPIPIRSPPNQQQQTLLSKSTPQCAKFGTLFGPASASPRARESARHRKENGLPKTMLGSPCQVPRTSTSPNCAPNASDPSRKSRNWTVLPGDSTSNRRCRATAAT